MLYFGNTGFPSDVSVTIAFYKSRGFPVFIKKGAVEKKIKSNSLFDRKWKEAAVTYIFV